MDFFEQEVKAHRHTRVLVSYLLVALAIIIGMAYFLLMATYRQYSENRSWVNGQVLLWVSSIILGIVLLGSLAKMISLRSGGKAVARLLGGEAVDPGTQDLAERRLLNVVEEMAIASGTPVPTVYLLRKERGINAFSAGFKPSDAVIGVTQGCLDTLNRNELEGVVAHEFSHILNSDMRLNIRLTSITHGIQVIGLIGYQLMNSALPSHFANDDDDDDVEGVPWIALIILLVVIGGIIFAIGYIGVFFAKLIKAAVSREREFLADASAVQFTRLGQGITHAMMKIGGATTGSLIRNSNAEQVSHMFFGNAVLGGWMRSLSTHPSLDQRIRRIDPSFDGVFPEVRVSTSTEPLSKFGGLTIEEAAVFQVAAVNIAGWSMSDRVGRPSREHLDYAAKLKASIPPEVLEATHDSVNARAVICALLLNREQEPRKAQLSVLKKEADQAVLQGLHRLGVTVMKLPMPCRLPLVDLTLPALRTLSHADYNTFQILMKDLIKADSHTNLFEYVLQRLLLRHLGPHFGQVQQGRIRFYGMSPLALDIEVLLAALARVGQSDNDKASAAFNLSLKHLSLQMTPRGKREIHLADIDKALKQLAQSSPPIKKRVLEACIACVSADGVAHVKEVELLRAIADAFDCPVPPFLPGQKI